MKKMLALSMALVLGICMISVVNAESNFEKITELAIVDGIEDSNNDNAALKTQSLESSTKGEKFIIIENDVEDEVSVRSVGIHRTFNLDTGESWDTTFDMGNWWWNDDHNAFKIKISDVEGDGSYTVFVKGSNGYKYESSESSTDKSIVITNAQEDVDYTVTISNTSTGNVSGTVKISSYYN